MWSLLMSCFIWPTVWNAEIFHLWPRETKKTQLRSWNQENVVSWFIKCQLQLKNISLWGHYQNILTQQQQSYLKVHLLAYSGAFDHIMQPYFKNKVLTYMLGGDRQEAPVAGNIRTISMTTTTSSSEEHLELGLFWRVNSNVWVGLVVM